MKTTLIKQNLCPMDWDVFLEAFFISGKTKIEAMRNWIESQEDFKERKHWAVLFINTLNDIEANKLPRWRAIFRFKYLVEHNYDDGFSIWVAEIYEPIKKIYKNLGLKIEFDGPEKMKENMFRFYDNWNNLNFLENYSVARDFIIDFAKEFESNQTSSPTIIKSNLMASEFAEFFKECINKGWFELPKRIDSKDGNEVNNYSESARLLLKIFEIRNNSGNVITPKSLGDLFTVKNVKLNVKTIRSFKDSIVDIETIKSHRTNSVTSKNHTDKQLKKKL